MAARNQIPAWVYLVIILTIALTAWLNRYRYHGNSLRQNRFTGAVERRVQTDDGHVEWHLDPYGRVDLPEGSAMIKPLDRPPRN